MLFIQNIVFSLANLFLVCLAEMDKNDSNEASDRCRDSVMCDQTKEECPASDVRWPDTRCQEGQMSSILTFYLN